MDMMPTMSLRWLVTDRRRVLQQLWVSMDDPDENSWDKGKPEWRDVPEVTIEEG